MQCQIYIIEAFSFFFQMTYTDNAWLQYKMKQKNCQISVFRNLFYDLQKNNFLSFFYRVIYKYIYDIKYCMSFIAYILKW